MSAMRLSGLGIVVAVLVSASAVFAANPGAAGRTTPGTTNFSATSGSRFVNATLSAQQTTNIAISNVTVGNWPFGRNTDSYGGSTQVRCNGSTKVYVGTFSGPTNTYSISCNNIGNSWAGTITIL